MGNKKHKLVGAPGFEPGASCAQGRRATRLRYAPTCETSILAYFLDFPTSPESYLVLITLEGLRPTLRCVTHFADADRGRRFFPTPLAPSSASSNPYKMNRFTDREEPRIGTRRENRTRPLRPHRAHRHRHRRLRRTWSPNGRSSRRSGSQPGPLCQKKKSAAYEPPKN